MSLMERISRETENLSDIEQAQAFCDHFDEGAMKELNEILRLVKTMGDTAVSETVERSNL